MDTATAVELPHEEVPLPTLTELDTLTRPIEPLHVPISTIGYSTVQDTKFEFRVVEPTTLRIDERYQRNLTRKSLKLIKKIVKEWSWTAFKLPICVEYEDGTLYIIDGQHTSIAAATHPDIAVIPVCIIDKKLLQGRRERAEAFVRHNIDRTPVSDIALFKARVEAGDEDAIGVQMALQKSGVTLVGTLLEEPKIGHLTCIKTVEQVYKRRGVRALRILLEVCIASKLAPINKHYVVALERLMYDEKNRNKFELQDLALTIRNYPYAQLVGDIEVRARQDKLTKNETAYRLIKDKYHELFD